MLVSGRVSASSVENFEATPSSQIVRVALVREYSNTPPIAMAVPGTRAVKRGFLLMFLLNDLSSKFQGVVV